MINDENQHSRCSALFKVTAQIGPSFPDTLTACSHFGKCVFDVSPLRRSTRHTARGPRSGQCGPHDTALSARATRNGLVHVGHTKWPCQCGPHDMALSTWGPHDMALSTWGPHDTALSTWATRYGHKLNPLKIRFTFPQRTVYLTVHKQLRYLSLIHI